MSGHSGIKWETRNCVQEVYHPTAESKKDFIRESFKIDGN